MKKLLTALLLFSVLYACNNKKDSKTAEIKEEKTENIKRDSLLITDNSWGLIDGSSDIEYLKKTFGEANVKDERICGPECVDSIDVTFIHPGTNKALTIYWQDSAYHKKIGMIEADDPGSPYHTAAGLRTGSSLRDLQKIYPGKIVFSGFGWDYGGFVQSLGDSTGNSSPLSMRLDLAEHTGEQGLYGDRELNTDMPLVKKHADRIIISSLTLAFSR